MIGIDYFCEAQWHLSTDLHLGWGVDFSEIEKLNLNDMTCREGVIAVAKM